MEYKTSDIILAAFLKTVGVKMIRIDKDGIKGTFVFEEPDPELLDMFDTGNADVEPVAFNNMVRQLTTACRR